MRDARLLKLRHVVYASAFVALGSAIASRPASLVAGQSQTPQLTRYQMSSTSDGAKLFIGYNCIDCHGPDGVGLMAPSFQDGRWRYGGSQDSVYRSIAEGRPDGMPAWGRLIPAAHIRQLAAYVSTLDDGKDVTTMSFVERSGNVSRPGH